MVTSEKILVEKLNQLIDDNLDNPLFTVDTICQVLGVSRSQLHRTVKEQTDLSISLYVRMRRLLKAKHLLLTTDLRITEIGDIVGITNPQNFSTYFIREFKVSPSEFRKRQAQPSDEASLPLETTPDELPPSASEQPTENRPAQPGFLQKRELVYAIGVAILLLAAGVGLYRWQQNRPASRPAQPVSNSLVVLPFVNLGAADSDPACESIMDDVHRSVSLIKNLKVIARSSSDQYKDTPKSIWQIGDDLQVANVLKGNVLKTGDQIQIKVEIINTNENIRVWLKKYSGHYKDLFQLTDQLVGDVARQLKLMPNALASQKVALDQTPNLDAYPFFLQGRQLVVTRIKANLQESLVRFDRALAIDSTFADAHAYKAVAIFLLPESEFANASEKQRLVEKSALTAIRLDPTNSTAYGSLGILYHDTRQWKAAEDAFRIALQYNPNDAQINYWYSLLLRSVGRLNEAIQYSTQAVALDPLHPIILSGHILNCVFAKQFDLAKTALESGRGLFDNTFSYQVANAFYSMGRADYNRAVADFQKGLVLNPDENGHIPVLMYCEAKRGNRQKAIAFLHKLTATTPRANYERAVVYAGLSETDSCLTYLKKAADAGYIYRDMKMLPVFAPYRSHPVFKAILRQYKLSEP
jgi:TolB-like protein/AraC-like DNA-binding protein/Tfp pilus assembly protein PilF